MKSRERCPPYRLRWLGPLPSLLLNRKNVRMWRCGLFYDRKNRDSFGNFLATIILNSNLQNVQLLTDEGNGYWRHNLLARNFMQTFKWILLCLWSVCVGSSNFNVGLDHKLTLPGIVAKQVYPTLSAIRIHTDERRSSVIHLGNPGAQSEQHTTNSMVITNSI